MASERKNMILADKIINERKKLNWSQEELAEKLDVSRQSVSKWEGAQSIPDISKILAMADLFGVSTDYLLKDEILPEETVSDPYIREDSEASGNLRKVSMEEANEFLDSRRKAAPKMAIASLLCVLSPVTLIMLAGLSTLENLNLSENAAAGIGLAVLFLNIAVAVCIFIITSHGNNKFRYLYTENFETAYGVSGMVKERRDAYDNTTHTLNTVGVMICILSPLPLIILSCLGAAPYVIVMMVCVLLTMVSSAVLFFVLAGVINGSFDVLLKEGDYTVKAKRSNKKLDNVTGIYWSVVTAGFLLYSFVTNDWARSWIVWPVAAVLFAAYRGIMAMVLKADE